MKVREILESKIKNTLIPYDQLHDNGEVAREIRQVYNKKYRGKIKHPSERRIVKMWAEMCLRNKIIQENPELVDMLRDLMTL